MSKDKVLNEDTSIFKQRADQKKDKDFEDALKDDGYNQEADADFSNMKIGGKHFIIKAPKRKTESGLILSEQTQKEVANVQDTPGLNQNVTVAAVADKCEMVEVGDHILLSPHTQALDIDLLSPEGEKVLYLLVHEDYVLIAEPSNTEE